MNSIVITNEHIKPDEEEEKLKETNPSALKSHQCIQRGLYPTTNGLRIVNKKFILYVLRKRVDIFRLSSGDYYIKNQITHKYIKTSRVIISAVFMLIMDEYDEWVYEQLDAEFDMLAMLEKLCPTYEKIEEDSTHILFPNGIYSLLDHSFDENKSYNGIFTSMQEYEYDSQAKCDVFLESIHKIFNGDMDRIALMQELFGYTFAYGEAPADKLPYLFGGGRNGKSALSDVLRKLHGADKVSAVSLEKLCERFQLSAIYGKRVNICPEVPLTKLMNSSMLKALTGGDSVVIERKYCNPFTDVMACKIFAMSNHFLRATDSSLGFWNRMITIPFEVTFLTAEELPNGETDYAKIGDPELGKKLEAELPGVFNWSIEGLKRLKENDWSFTEPEACVRLKEQMMLLNKPITVFVSNCIDRGNLDRNAGKIDSVMTSDAHKKFIEWANVNEVEIPDYNQPKNFHKEFREALHSHGIPFDRHKSSVDYYDGIIINKNYQMKLG